MKKCIYCNINECGGRSQYCSISCREKMSWDNYGEWHIDHIKPLSKFDLSDPEEFKQACHYTNLQPLWAEDNFKKGDRCE